MKIFVTLLSLFLFSNLYSQDIDYEKLNGLYYDLNDYDFKGFSADVESETLDQLIKSTKDDNYLSILNDISFNLEFYPKDSVNFTSSEVKKSGNEQFDNGVSQIIKGIKQTVEGFFQSWSEFSLSPAFVPEKYNYNVQTEANLTELKYEDNGNEVTMYLNNMMSIDSLHISNTSSNTQMYLTYELTNFNKRIIKAFSIIINNYVDIRMEIGYKGFDKILIPETITIIQKMPGMNQQSTITFKNIVLL